jgi:hypothetical protein
VGLCLLSLRQISTRIEIDSFLPVDLVTGDPAMVPDSYLIAEQNVHLVLHPRPVVPSSRSLVIRKSCSNSDSACQVSASDFLSLVPAVYCRHPKGHSDHLFPTSVLQAPPVAGLARIPVACSSSRTAAAAVL